MSIFGKNDALPRTAKAITKSDSTELTLTGLYVGGAGNVALLLAGDSAAVTFTAVPAGTFMPLQIKKVMETNTTATDMVGLG